jgi:hypothetical protein
MENQRQDDESAIRLQPNSDKPVPKGFFTTRVPAVLSQAVQAEATKKHKGI